MNCIFDETGCIHQLQTGEHAPDGLLCAPWGLGVEKAGETYYMAYIDNEWAPVLRPASPEIAKVGEAPFAIDLSPQPQGTSLKVTNAHGDTLTVNDWNEPLRLTDAGSYTIQITAPFPAHSFRQTIEVINA